MVTIPENCEVRIAPECQEHQGALRCAHYGAKALQIVRDGPAIFVIRSQWYNGNRASIGDSVGTVENANVEFEASMNWLLDGFGAQ